MARLDNAAIRERQTPESSRLLLYRGGIDNALPQDELDARVPNNSPDTVLELVRQRLSGEKALTRVY
jgi:hypothetical protein